MIGFVANTLDLIAMWTTRSPLESSMNSATSEPT